MEEANKSGRRLGRGLSELLGEAKAMVSGATEDAERLNKISESRINETVSQEEGNIKFSKFKQQVMLAPIETIVKNPEQPRRFFDEAALKELANSIKIHGVLQPLIVSRRSKDGEDFLLLIAGERRWRASQLAGLSHVPVIVSDAEPLAVHEIALIENLQREDLKPLEEAKALFELMDKFDLTQSEVADKVGKSRSFVANAVRLLELSQKIRDYLDADLISVGHAKLFMNFDKADAVVDQVIKKGMSVRETEKLIASFGNMRISAFPSPKKEDPDKLNLEADLSSVLGMKVKIETDQQNKGRLTVQFSSLKELDELCKRLSQSAGEDE